MPFLLPLTASASNCVWDGGGDASTWSDSDNWTGCGSSYPGDGGIGSDQATIDTTGLTVTLDVNPNLSDFDLSGSGILDATSRTISVTGDLALSGIGSLTTTGGLLVFEGSSAQSFATNGQTFNTIQNSNTGSTVTLEGALTTTSFTNDASATFNINGKNFTTTPVTGFTNSGTFQLDGDEALMGTDTTQGEWEFLGNGTSFTLPDAGLGTDYTTLTINASSTDVTVGADLTVTGTFTIQNGQVDVSGRTVNAGTFTVSGGTLELDGTETFSSATPTFGNSSTALYTGASGTIFDFSPNSYGSLEIDSAGIYNFQTPGGNLDIDADLTITNGTLTAPTTVNVGGNLTNNDTIDVSTNSANFTFDESQTRTITDSSTTYNQITVSNGTLNEGANLTVTDLLILSGATFDMNGSNLTFDPAATTFTNAGTFRLEGGETFTLAGTATQDNTQGTWEYYGDGLGTIFNIIDHNTVGTDDYYNLIINNSADEFFLSGTAGTDELEVANDLTVSNGTFDISGYDTTIGGTGTFTLSNGATFRLNGENLLEATNDTEVFDPAFTSFASGSFTQFQESSGDCTSGDPCQIPDYAYGHLEITGSGYYDLDFGITTFNNLEVSSGTLDANDPSGDITVSENVILSGGTLIGPSSASGDALHVEGDWINTGGFFDITSFGLVVFDGATTQEVTTNGDSFYDLQTSVASTDLELQDAITITNSLTIDSGTTFDAEAQSVTLATLINNGTYELHGTNGQSLTHTTHDAANGLFLYTGDTDGFTDTDFLIQDFGATDYYNIQINSADGTLDTFSPAAQLDVANNFTLTDGEYSTGSQTNNVIGSFQQTGGDMTHNSDLNVDGLLNLDAGNWTQTGDLYLAGDLDIEAAHFLTSTAGKLEINGASGTQNYNHDGGENFFNMVINKAADELILNTALTLDNDFTQTLGDLDCNTQNITVAGAFTHTAGTFDEGGGQCTGAIDIAVDLSLNSTSSFRHNSNITVAGNVLIDALASLDLGSSSQITLDSTSGSQTLTTNAKTLYNLILDNEDTGITLVDALTTTGNLTLAADSTTVSAQADLSVGGALTAATSSTLTMDGNALTVTGTHTNNGTLQLDGDETLTFTTGFDSTNGTTEYLGNDNGSAETPNLLAAYNNLIINDSNATQDIFTTNANLLVNGDLTLTESGLDASLFELDVDGDIIFAAAGTLIAPGATLAFTLAGDFDNSAAGTFTHNSGAISFDGAASADVTQTISGNNSFFDFTADNSAHSNEHTLELLTGNEQSIAGTLTLQGNTTDELIFKSSLESATNEANIDLTDDSTTDIDYVTVSFVDNLDDEYADFITAENSSGDSESDNWIFVGSLSATADVSSTTRSASTNVTVSFTTVNEIPANGRIIISFPTGFTISTVDTLTDLGGNLDGDFTFSTSANDLTITRDGLGSLVDAASAVSFRLNTITNPSSTGVTGDFAVETQLSDGRTIDQDTSVAGLTLTAPGGGGGGGGGGNSTSKTEEEIEEEEVLEELLDLSCLEPTFSSLYPAENAVTNIIPQVRFVTTPDTLTESAAILLDGAEMPLTIFLQSDGNYQVIADVHSLELSQGVHRITIKGGVEQDATESEIEAGVTFENCVQEYDYFFFINDDAEQLPTTETSDPIDENPTDSADSTDSTDTSETDTTDSSEETVTTQDEVVLEIDGEIVDLSEIETVSEAPAESSVEGEVSVSESGVIEVETQLTSSNPNVEVDVIFAANTEVKTSGGESSGEAYTQEIEGPRPVDFYGDIPAGFNIIGEVYEVGPEGVSLTLSEPMTIRLPITLEIGIEDPEIYHYNEALELWHAEGGILVVDSSGQYYLETQVDHLSKFAIFAVSLAGDIESYHPFDDAVGHWSESYIEELYNIGVVSGQAERVYGPEDLVTRSEFTKIVLGLHKNVISSANTETPFYDVDESDWSAPYIAFAYNSGLINGYEDGSFRPNATITRAEALSILFKSSEMNLETSFDAGFTDIPDGEWFTEVVNLAAQYQIVNGYGNGSFGPADPLTRGQAAKVGSKFGTDLLDTGLARMATRPRLLRR